MLPWRRWGAPQVGGQPPDKTWGPWRPSLEHFQVDVSFETPLPVITVTGELDASTAPVFSHALEAALGRAGDGLVVNLTATRYIDSSGIQSLLRLYHHTRRFGPKVMLVDRTDPVRKVFQLVGIGRLFPIHPDQETAFEAFRVLETQ
jgi:anti-sigma B factor antagonist